MTRRRGSARAKSWKARARCDSASRPSRPPAVLLLRAHLAEGTRMAVGQEHRVVAEALVAARRPDQRAVDAAGEGLDLAVRRGERQHGRRNARGAAPAWSRPSPAARPRPSAWRARNPSPVRPSAPNRCRARRRAHRPRGRNRRRARQARTHPPRRCAFRIAFASNVVPVSSGSARPSSAADFTAIPNGAEQIDDLAHLARIVARHDDRAGREDGSRIAQSTASFCRSTSLRDAGARELQQR